MKLYQFMATNQIIMYLCTEEKLSTLLKKNTNKNG